MNAKIDLGINKEYYKFRCVQNVNFLFVMFYQESRPSSRKKKYPQRAIHI